MKSPNFSPPLLPLTLLFLVLGTLLVSGFNPYDRFTWWLEVLPVFLGLTILIPTYRRFPLTLLAYHLIAIHMILLLVGGHYTYARVPLGDWIKELAHFERNHFDRIGHFFQGLVPALIAREILIRRQIIPSAPWRNFFIISFVLALSAGYELVEWITAELTGTAAHDFIGSQGDEWDTQKDMALALLGAIFTLIFLRTPHDRQIKQLTTTPKISL